MTDGDDRIHVLDYTHVDLLYVEAQRKNKVNKFKLLKQELSLHKFELSLGGRGKRKEKISLKEVLFTKADESSYVQIPKITSDSELNTIPSSDKVSPTYVIKKRSNTLPVVLEACSDKKSDSSTEQLLLTLMEEDYLKRSIIVNRHGKTAYDVFRGRSPDISYFYVFGCLVPIHNHMDHWGKFDEKADDGFFLGYSPVAKAFRVFNIKRQEMEETVHVTFSEDDEAIS
ncbi:hypothetical protein Tco_0627724 [Tanacetum coccineum]|uniref:Retroviral polymerase SH3-like domain-containing protein n=1 Tax=Tanacetum coccineum TaxID=301880 RepID=A0ABQ4WN79_9ASTR